MSTYKYYQPNEVVFREGYHNHKGNNWEETGTYELENFLSENGDLPDKDPHALYFLDTTVINTGDGSNLDEDEAKNRTAVVLFKGDKPVSVDYKYILNPPKIKVEDYGLCFESLFSQYKRTENLTPSTDAE